MRVIDPPAVPLAASIAPNPLNTSGVLRFKTTRLGPARMRVFDVRGRLVRTLLDVPMLPAGVHRRAG